MTSGLKSGKCRKGPHLSLRTAAVTAGVIKVMPLAKFIAIQNMTTRNRTTTFEYISKCSALTRQHLDAELLEILIAVMAQDIAGS